MKCILSYGGGVNSSALLFHLLDQNIYLDLVIFSDTGEESAETYDAVKRMKLICETHLIKFATVRSSKGRLVDYYFENKAVPSIMRRDCTSKFKISPIRQYLRRVFGKKETFIQYIGIAYDEMHRAVCSDVKYIENVYPFISSRITRQGCFDILKLHSFVASKSGCVGCPFMSKLGFHKLKLSDPLNFKRWMVMEENGSRFPELTLNPRFKMRDVWDQTYLFDPEDDDFTEGCSSAHCFI